MTKKQDVRITKTLQSIRHAFLTLLEEKNFEAVTVQDILDKAQINRSTFYKHFANKDEVAKNIVNEIKTLFMEHFALRFTVPTAEFGYLIRPVFWQNRELVRLIGKIETPKIHLFNDIHQMIKAEYIKRAAQEFDKTPEELDFQGHLFATISLGMMKYFMEKNELPPVENVLANVTDVINLLIIKDKKSPNRN